MNTSHKLGFILTAVAAVSTSRTVHAQIPVANAAAFGMAGNFTAVARGFEAIAFNPANLALGKPTAFGLSLLSVGVNSAINPVKLSDFKAHERSVVPAATRENWLQRIGSGRQQGGTEAGVSFLALNIRNFGAQAGLVAAGEINLNQDAAEALLFGNSGRTGTAKSFEFSGSSANGSLFGVGAVSYAIPMRTSANGDQVAVGLTVKYVRGIAAGRAADNGSTTTPNDVNVQFPVIYTDSAHVGNAGSGVGFDVGLSWTKATTTFSVTGRNLVNTFKWSTAAFSSRPGGFTFDGNNSESQFDAEAYANAPEAMRRAFELEKFKPEIAAGVARRMGDLLVSADAAQRFGDGIAIGPKMHVGMGAEYTGVSVLALRAGASAITGGFQGAAGLGIRLRGLEMSAGVMTRSTNGKSGTGVVFNLLSVR